MLATLHLDAVPRRLARSTMEAVGSAWSATLSSFCFFASGALVPVLPCLFGASGWTAVVIATALVGIALLGTGAVVGLLSGASPLKQALRQLAIGYGAQRPSPISWAVRSVPPWVKRVSCSGRPNARRLSRKDFNDDARRRTASWVLTHPDPSRRASRLLLLHRSGRSSPDGSWCPATSHRRRGCRSTRDRMGGLRGDGVGPRRIGDSVRTQVRNNRPAHDSRVRLSPRPTTSR